MSVAITDRNGPVAERAKELLADPRLRIAFDGFMNEHLRAALEALSPAHFPLTGGDAKDFADRVEAYEDAMRALMEIVILLARWGDADGRLQLEKILSRLADTAAVSGGAVLWLQLRWYPLLMLMYVAGIAGLSARRFDMLDAALTFRSFGWYAC